MKKKELTPQQKRIVMEITLSGNSILSKRDQFAILGLPPEIMSKNLLRYIETRWSLKDEVMVRVFQRHEDVGKDVIKACIKISSQMCEAAQMELFNMPAQLRDEMLICFAAKSGHGPLRFCDAAVMAILKLPLTSMLKILSVYLKGGNWLSKEAQAKIIGFPQEVSEKIFADYRHIPETLVFDKVLTDWTDESKKKIFLDNIKKIDQYTFKYSYDEMKGMMNLVFGFPQKVRDKLLQAYMDRGELSGEVMKKICELEDPSRKNLLKLKMYSSEGIDLIFGLPEPSKTELLLDQINKSDWSPLSGEQIKALFKFPEPNRSELLKAYATRFYNLFERAEKEVLKLPDPLCTEIVLKCAGNSDITSATVDRLFRLKEPLKTKALSVYFAGSKAETKYLSKVFKLPEPSKSIILLAAIKAKKNMYLFNEFNISSSPYKKQLFELSEPYKTEVITAFVENGWELDEPWMLWLLPKATREPLIKVYAKKHDRFDPAYYEAKVKELLGEIPD